MVPASKDLLTYLDPPVHSQEPNLSSSSSQVTPLLGKGTVFFVVNQIQKELLVNLHRSRIVYWIYFNFISFYCSIENNFLAISHSYGERLHWTTERRVFDFQ